jgi:hypothetical protein
LISIEGAEMKYHHTGIPTLSPKEGESYLEDFDVHCTDHESNPFGIQWMRYGKNCTLPGIVQGMPHIAFEVEDLEKALEGHEVIIKPNSPSSGVRVAFILENGVPVEFLQFEGTGND